MSIIVPNICGGLGNQLYFIAQAYVYGKRHNKIIKIKKEMEYGSYGRPRPTYYDTVFHKFDVIDIDQNEINKYNHINENELDVYKENNIYMNGGYFQKTKYLVPYLSELQYIFSPPEYIKNNIDNIINLNKLNLDSDIVVHIRLVDDWTPGDFSNIYKPHELERVKEFIKNELENTKNNIILFSNNINKAIELLNIDNTRVFKSNYSDYEELYLMSMFRRFILSPSTFNIWGVMLSQKENKEINIFWDNNIHDYSNYRIDFYEQCKFIKS